MHQQQSASRLSVRFDQREKAERRHAAASATAHNARSSRASLLSIPSEIRLHVYRFICEESRIKIHFVSELDGVDGDPQRRIELGSYAQSISRTCRLLGTESLPILHDITTLRVCAASSDLLDHDPYQFMRSLSQSLLQHIRHLSVDRIIIEYIPLGKLTNLKTMTVTNVVCMKFDLRENALARNEEAVRAIERIIRDNNTYYHVNRVRGRLGRTDRRYKLLCECSLFHFRDCPGPCLVSDPAAEAREIQNDPG